MGRQTLVAMTDNDEEVFISFLRSTADIQLLEYFAPTRESIWVDSFSSRERGHWTYNIWNRAFDWTAEYGQVRDDLPSTQNPGWFFVSNISDAPVIEYSRHDFHDDTDLTYGRVYWAKSFATPPEYDLQAFSNWYDEVVRWIRKNGTQIDRGAYNTYYLPDAMRQVYKLRPDVSG